ncbi:MAG: EpsG family protein [Sphingobacterium sp.]|jgi:hypothetical protein|uniref:EpsG family protein n=1 Tax=Sphingobacterium sp. TaxID=341027 RepID=UPI00284103C7|nr:EpsG family protein [Sphingobacterium sp.]MDR3011469.1 EpsG family protein [Sphingobacterium sp.]
MSKFWFRFYFLAFVLVAGLRYKVGGDTNNYINHWETLPLLNEMSLSDILKMAWNPLWIVLSSATKMVSQEFFVFQLVHAIIFNFAIFKFIDKYSEFRFFSLLIYFIGFYFYYNMEILRESLAIAMFIIGYIYYNKGRFLYFSIFILLAILFHTSAIIALFIPIFSRIKFNAIGITTVLFLGVGLLFFSDKIMVIFLTENSMSKISNYSNIIANANGIITNAVMYIVVPSLFLKFYIKNSIRPLFENLYLFYFFIALLVVFIPGFSRFLNYFFPFMLIIFSNIIYQIYNLNKFRGVRNIFAMTFTFLILLPKIIYYMGDTSKYYPNSIKLNLWYPYSSVLEKEEYPARQIIFRETMKELSK